MVNHLHVGTAENDKVEKENTLRRDRRKADRVRRVCFTLDTASELLLLLVLRTRGLLEISLGLSGVNVEEVERLKLEGMILELQELQLVLLLRER